jgi:hypothetical protein
MNNLAAAAAVLRQTLDQPVRPKHCGFHCRIVGQHRYDCLLPGGGASRLKGNLSTLLGQSVSRLAGTVIQRHLMMGADKIARHRRSHVAKSKKSNAHDEVSS